MHALLFPDVSRWVPEVLTHLWQSTLVALAILVLLRGCRGLPAHVRRALGWLALAKFAVPAAWIGAVFERFAGAPRPWLASDTLLVPVPLAAMMPAAPVLAADAAAPVFTAVDSAVLVWVLGAVVLLSWWTIRAVHVRRHVLAAARPAPAGLQRAVDCSAERTGLRSGVDCRVVAREHGPGIMGIRRPLLIVPEGLVESLASAERDAILLHECVHLKRRDNLLSAVLAIFTAVFWFNPVIWWLRREIARETEQSCDEQVVAITGDADTYAQGILHAVQHNLGLMTPGLAAATTPPVLGRIQNILAQPSRRRRPFATAAALGGGLFVLGLSGHAGAITAGGADARTSQPDAGQAVEVASARQNESPAAEKKDARPSGVTIRREAVRDAIDANLRSRPASEERAQAAPREFGRVLTADGTPVSQAVEPTSPPSSPSPAEAAALEQVRDELAAARVKLEQANAELRRLREERAAALARQKAEDEREGRTGNVQLPRPVAPQEPRRATYIAASDTGLTPPPDVVRIRVYDFTDVQQAPVPMFQARPRYPFEARRQNLAGEVVVSFIVDEKGDVQNAYASKASTDDFAAAAVAAVSRWRYRAALKDRQPVAVRMQVPIYFTLNDEATERIDIRDRPAKGTK